ncbi:hypothetical protein Desaci_4087 [Desulfosporosinus acidiphilus SJ4]|uniref:Uncharacterized protein n=1 Tax=Desulfosporosinus acidiphilus (strain DSM 22704 / JCM 16185 / SJ4) TaxID=646529 RepID=I4DAX6_DESAJ|nr:hypothetical protein [Desulfosporosinus acidiphilus]AFM42950.1 hypothetical protein Desaci_4087 [Desulfosporosinus acidiphilus SJ4]
MTVSGGFGASASGTTNSNGYYNVSIKPSNVGGPFPLSFAVTSSYGNFNTIQNSITVTTPIAVPVQDVLQGVTISGQTGTMPNMAIANPNGMGAGRSMSLQYWTGGGSTLFLKPQTGYYDGIDTWTYYTDPNLTPSNIKSGVSIFGVTGTYSGGTSTHGSQSWTTPGTYYWTVPDGVNSLTAAITGAGGGSSGGATTGSQVAYGGGGGSGGTYIGPVPVTPGQIIVIVVGTGGISKSGNTLVYSPGVFGAQGSNGGDSSVAGVVGHGGTAGTPGMFASGWFPDNGSGGVGGAGGGYGSNGLNGSNMGVGGQSTFQGLGYGGSGYNGGNGKVTIQW